MFAYLRTYTYKYIHTQMGDKIPRRGQGVMSYVREEEISIDLDRGGGGGGAGGGRRGSGGGGGGVGGNESTYVTFLGMGQTDPDWEEEGTIFARQFYLSYNR